MNLSALPARREAITQIAARRGASRVRVLGSVARGDAGPDSDVDFLVDLEEGRSSLDLAGLAIDLDDLLGCAVDVGLERALRRRLKDRVLREAVAL